MTALARLRERGDREAVGEGIADGDGRKQPLTPGFAVPSPLGEGCYQVRRSRQFEMSKLQAQGASPGGTGPISCFLLGASHSPGPKDLGDVTPRRTPKETYRISSSPRARALGYAISRLRGYRHRDFDGVENKGLIERCTGFWKLNRAAAATFHLAAATPF